MRPAASHSHSHACTTTKKKAHRPQAFDDDGAGGNFSFFGEQETFSKVLGASRQKRRTAGHALYINDY